jgi:hypothetical protein
MIYVLGDSFSTGAELSDHLIPSWPGHKSTETDHVAYQKWYNDPATQKEIDDIENRAGLEIFFNNQQALSWPGQLAKITGIEVINQSVSGSGPSYWPYKLAQDLNEYSPDTVILQFTSFDREVLFVRENISAVRAKFVSAGTLPMAGLETDYFISLKMLEDFVANFYRFLLTVSISQAICRGHGVKNIHVVSTFNFVDAVLPPIGEYTTLMQYPDIAKAWNNTGVDWLNIDTIQSSSSRDHCWLAEMPNGHYNADTYRRFAEMIADKYIVNTA